MRSSNNNEKLFSLIKRGVFSKKNCFEWQGAKDKNGYGITSYPANNTKKRSWKVHRLIWTILNGDVPEDILVCHICDNPSCFNINHLFLGTSKDNSQDREKKGRGFFGQKGEQNFAAKLNEPTVLLIRKFYENGWRVGEIAKEFNIHQSHISRIVHRKEWKHI
jgi:hypothetical protein